MGDDIFTLRSGVIKALAHPARVQIVDLLMQRDEVCVCDMIEPLRVSQPTVSKHLAVLRAAGIVSSRKDGLSVFYRLRMRCFGTLFKGIDGLIQANVEARQTQVFAGSKSRP